MATKLQLSWFIFLCSRITDLCHHTWIQKASLTMSLVGFTYARASFWGVWGHIINMDMFNLCRRTESIDTLVRKGSHFRCNYVGRKRHTTNKQMPLPPKKGETRLEIIRHTGWIIWGLTWFWKRDSWAACESSCPWYLEDEWDETSDW